MTFEVSVHESKSPEIEHTRFVLVTGPLGAGKTTFINNLLEQHGDRLGSVAVVVNDFGDQNIDASRIRADAIRGLSHECVCCGSWREFGDTLVELSGNFETVIIEPTGVADPTRIHEVARTKGITLHTIAVTDSHNMERNEALGLQGPAIDVADQVVVSRLGSAGLGALEIPNHVQSYIADRRSDILPVALGLDQVPVEILETLLLEKDIELGAATEHRHGEHGPGHAFTRLTLALHSDVTMDDVAIALREFPGDVERAKGTASDGSFDFVHGDLSPLACREDIDATASPRSQMILISSDPEMNFTQFLTIGIPPLPELGDLRSLAALYPNVKKTLVDGGKLTPHFEEADAAYARMYPIRNVREQIPDSSEQGAFDERWEVALSSYLNYRVELAAVLNQGSELGEQNEEQRPYLSRETGLILAWHALNYPDDIGAEQHAAIRAAQPASLFFAGCSSATEPSAFAAHEELSDGVISEIVDVARFGLLYEGLEPGQIQRHLLQAASVMSDYWEQEQVQKLIKAISEIER